MTHKSVEEIVEENLIASRNTVARHAEQFRKNIEELSNEYQGIARKAFLSGLIIGAAGAALVVVTGILISFLAVHIIR